MTSSSSEVWKSSLNATCNRLSKEYLNLLRAASSVSLDENPGGDPRGKLQLQRSIILIYDNMCIYSDPFYF